MDPRDNKDDREDDFAVLSQWRSRKRRARTMARSLDGIERSIVLTLEVKRHGQA